MQGSLVGRLLRRTKVLEGIRRLTTVAPVRAVRRVGRLAVNARRVVWYIGGVRIAMKSVSAAIKVVSPRWAISVIRSMRAAGLFSAMGASGKFLRFIRGGGAGTRWLMHALVVLVSHGQPYCDVDHVAGQRRACHVTVVVVACRGVGAFKFGVRFAGGDCLFAMTDRWHCCDDVGARSSLQVQDACRVARCKSKDSTVCESLPSRFILAQPRSRLPILARSSSPSFQPVGRMIILLDCVLRLCVSLSV